MPLKILGNEKLQLFFLKKAINEILAFCKEDKETAIVEKLQIEIDHMKGVNYINTLQHPLTFPLYIKNHIARLDKTKSLDYNFIGTVTEHRNWITKYTGHNTIIKNSNNGRNPAIKYNIDEEYYDILSKSKFTLTPTGECPWSYRFFEAIMCFSIPILEQNSQDIFMKDYFFYYDNDTHMYLEEKAQANYNTFIKSKHFLEPSLFE
jgi:hypothetical protein